MSKKQHAKRPLEVFKARLGLTRSGISEMGRDILRGARGGELFLEQTQVISVSLDEGRISATAQLDEGFGLERVSKEGVFFSSGNELTPDAIRAQAAELRMFAGVSDKYTKIPFTESLRKRKPYYPDSYSALSDDELIPCLSTLLSSLDEYFRTDSVVVNVGGSCVCNRTLVLIVRPDGTLIEDVRPMVRLGVWLQCCDPMTGRRATASGAWGGTDDVSIFWDADAVAQFSDQILEEAKAKLRARPCPSGEMPVVIGNGWGGVLLHEAIGHGFEADHIWRGESVFAGMLGERVASDLVTIVDDGTVSRARGSINCDDEGVPTECTMLVERGILKSYMHDSRSARIMGMKPTGNARRESYEHPVQVRMRNTYMLSGETPPEEIIASTEQGLFVKSFAGGQVDPISGKFTFFAEVAWLIKDGKLAEPVTGATLVGSCKDVLTFVDLVGNDGKLSGAGTCGKGGQSVPVGIGQPTLRIKMGGIVVGGTEQGGK